MPIYEYGCRSCRTRSSILVRSYDAPTDPACQNCGASGIVKLVSGFAIIRSEEDLMSGHDQMDWLYDLDPDDPEGLQKIKDWSNKSGVQDDGPMGPDNVHQDDLGVRSSLLKNYNIDIGAGLGPLEGKIWRIGLMGYTSRKDNIELLLSALKDTL